MRCFAGNSLPTLYFHGKFIPDCTMQGPNLFQVLEIDDYAATPKYLQIANGIIRGIATLPLEEGYLLPSIHDMSHELEVAKDTVEKAYRQLKQLGVVGSVHGKGYFIAKTDFRQPYKVLLVFNKLSAHKKVLYDVFASTLGNLAAIDFYIYNNDFSLFRRIIEQHQQGYTHYVIIPHFLEGGEQAGEVISQLSSGQVILLDKGLDDVQVPHGAVYEDFEADIFQALQDALPRLKCYQRLTMIFPAHSYFPGEIRRGFERFCAQHQLPWRVVNQLDEMTMERGDVYINLMEDDLLELLERIQESSLEVGSDIGIISYNETPWKRFILQGITTISTDFQLMGQMAASMVLNGQLNRQAVPFRIRLRASL